MKPIIATAATLVWFALAAPSEAVAGAVAAAAPAPSPRIGMRLGAWQIYGLTGPSLYNRRAYNRHRHDRRFLGFRHYASGPMLPPRAVRRSLRADEFFRVSYPRLRRGYYHARARDAHGRRVRLVIDPYNGDIIRLRFR